MSSVAVSKSLIFTLIGQSFVSLSQRTFDFANTFFERVDDKQPKARRGHSKEKRSDCPLPTLGLVLDGSGFVQRSDAFPSNVKESSTGWLHDGSVTSCPGTDL